MRFRVVYCVFEVSDKRLGNMVNAFVLFFVCLWRLVGKYCVFLIMTLLYKKENKRLRYGGFHKKSLAVSYLFDFFKT